MENRNDRPDRPLGPGRRFYDSQNRQVPAKPRSPDRPGVRRYGADEERDGRPARDEESRQLADMGLAPAPRGTRSDRPPFGDKPRYPNRPAADRSIDMLFGLRPILEALNAGRTLDKIFLLRGTKNSMVTDISDLARKAGAPVSLVPSEKLDGLTRKNHQGAVAFVSPISYAPLDNLLAGLFEEGKTPFLLVLDRITDVRNFGAIARSAECLGVQALVVPGRGAAQINGDALKTSAGALNLLPVCRENNLRDTLQFLKQSGLTIIACTEKADAAVGTAEVDFSGPVAILMGSEEDGIDPDLLRLADVRLRIPMIGQIQSLNVGVAAGIMLFEVARQRAAQ
ncbi:23S rRNA (guanosine(2251)-2'-O)-methyltransferase RlmB [uncultured Hymenobacter sp.]|uniref:23S rRNA (guanosine(2251)-2'-O)-methyltransferase RlmB n=1 Tax=uncultured Hymenobacter sp. TaxID=170016 RepID=UPI0035CA6D16